MARPRFFILFLQTLIALGTLSLPQAIASDDSCSRKILEELPHNPLQKIPVYEQGQLGDCYAHVASELVDYWRLSHGEKLEKSGLTHPLYAAYLTKASALYSLIHGKSMDGGTPYYAISALREKGLCKESVVNASLASFKKDPAMTDRKVIAIIQWVMADVPNRWNDLMFQHSVADPGAPYCHGYDGVFRPEAIERLMPYFSAHDLGGAFGELFKECRKSENRVPINVPEPRDWMIKNQTPNADIINELNALLDEKNPQPIGVGFCSDLFNHAPGFRGAENSIVGYRSLPASCGPHSALVTGRRSVNGKCQFLVRNSWGNYCNGMTLPCEWKSKKRLLGTWVDAEDLAANTAMVTTLPAQQGK